MQGRIISSPILFTSWVHLSQHPLSLAYRLVRIESTKDGLEHNLIKLQHELVSRGYRAASVKAAIDRAKLLARNQVLEKVQKKANQRPVFCVPYDPSNSEKETLGSSFKGCGREGILSRAATCDIY